MKGRILVADDEQNIRRTMEMIHEGAGYQVHCVETGQAALDFLAGCESGTEVDLVYLDIEMPGVDGMAALAKIRETRPSQAVVMISGHASVERAVEALKLGAVDFLEKGFSKARLLATTESVIERVALRRENAKLKARVEGVGEILGGSELMSALREQIARVADTPARVLITGESGTGKELVARAIHAAGPRADRAFVTVNAAAIPRELLESELFGHERGAFTGAVESREGRFREASGGTLFLDEIGDMPVDLQAKLLRVLQSGEVTPVGGRRPTPVDVRILAATHRDLAAAVEAGSFREDLLYRLQVVPIELPPLRERREDIATLAGHFLDRYGPELAGAEKHLSEECVSFLAGLPWPGNVRELENAIKRAVVLSPSEVLSPDDFAFLTADRGGERESDLEALVLAELRLAVEREPAVDLYREFLSRVEKPMIEFALAQTEGNQIRAAALLGINRNTLRKKITVLGIDVRGGS